MKNSTKASLDTISFKNLRRLYLFALLTIAVTVLLSQLLIQYNLNSQLSDSKIINISTEQRMLSQRLTKEVLITTSLPIASKSNKKSLVSTKRLLNGNSITMHWKMGMIVWGFQKKKHRL